MNRFSLLFHRFTRLKRSSRFAKKSVGRNGVAGFCLASGLVLTERTEGGNKPEKSITFTEQPPLTHQFVLKQAR